MAKRIDLVGKAYGRYHVIEYKWYDYDAGGIFYICVDMPTGKKKLIRADHLQLIHKNYLQTLKEIEIIIKYKKDNNLK